MSADPYAGIATLVDDDPYAGIATLADENGRDLSAFKTPDEVQAELNKLPDDKAKTAWLRDWAAQRVASNGVPGGKATRLFNMGMPWGSLLDEATAGISAAGNAISGGRIGRPYEQGKALEDAANAEAQRSSDESTKIGSLPVIGDVTAGGLVKLAGGLASAPFVPMARVMQGNTLVPRIANWATTGAAAGAVHGVGEGEGAERLANAGRGAAAGAATGAVLAPIASGAENVARTVADWMKPLPAELSGLNRGAIARVERAMRDDNLPQTYQAQVRTLGPEGMLADMGPNLRDQAGAIANRPGSGQTVLREALDTRNAGAEGRIRSDIDTAFGPETNVIREENFRVARSNAASAPYFDQFYQTDIPMTPRLTQIAERLPDEVLARANAIAEAEGYPLVTMRPDPITGQPVETVTPRGWDYYKSAIQEMLNERVDPTSRYGRALTELDNAIRNEVDALLSPGNPAASVWARGRAIAGEGKQFAQGLRDGDGIFTRPKTHRPDQVQEDLHNATPAFEEGYRMGARGDLANMANDAATQFGPSGDRALRKGMWSRNAERKVDQLARTPDAGRQVLRRRDAESEFANTRNEVTSNSATARRLAAQKEFPAPIEKEASGGRMDTTAVGLVAALVRKGVNAATLGRYNEHLSRMADNAARLLSATGMQRDQYFAGLTRHLQTQGLSARQAAAVSRAVETMMIGSVPTVSGAATSRVAP